MRRFVLLAAVPALFVGFGATGGPQPATAAATAVKVKVLSNRADLISGGDALVEIAVSRALVPDVRVDLDGRDVTDAFAIRPNRRFQGLVEGLELGENVLTARLPDSHGARITITNHPAGGPIFAGPQVRPWICETDAAGLGAPQDSQCNAPPVYLYHYKSSATGQFARYDLANPPADVATTTTDQGVTVPYIVREEKGAIDRGIYDIAVLHDPSKQWAPWASQPAWNHKLFWLFGGNCTPGHRQRTGGGNVLNDLALSRGFMVAAGSMTVLGNNCNTVVAAETVMMTKERIAERYGRIRYTIGNGCSGGSMMQHEIADNYPGLLDGLRPTCSFADIWAVATVDSFDCSLLDKYLKSSPLFTTAAQRMSVTGYSSDNWCTSSMAPFTPNWWLPANGNACGDATASWVYKPVTNPQGTRCDLADYAVAVLGKRGLDGFANRMLDNVGVQYGLKGLLDGAITPEQFFDLNEKVGGWDIDGAFQLQRTQADHDALDRMYRAGRILYGRELAKVPIIDVRGSGNGDVHTNLHPYITRARLLRTNGHAENRAIWHEPTTSFSTTAATAATSFLVMDQWLAAIEADRSGGPLEAKVLRNKPAEAADGCFQSGNRVADDVCASHPVFADPRLVAGMSMTRDVLKCQLKPPNRADYAPITFTDAQWARLRAAFPGGVCDWSKPGVGQRPPVGTWLTFADGPGGRPLGRAPRSTSF